MKIEGRIMAEGTGGNMDNKSNEIITSTEPNKGNTGVEKGGVRKVETPESVKARKEAKDKEILDNKLKEQRIVVGVDKEGKPVEKTVFDVIEGGRKALGELIDTDKWSEKSVKSFSDTRKLVEWSESEEGKKFVDSLVNKDVKDDSEKKEVEGIADIILKDVWKGDIAEGREWFKSQLDKTKNVKVGDSVGRDDSIKYLGLNEREQYVLRNMLSNKIAPASGEGSGGAGGIGAAPIDGAVGEAGQVIPAPQGLDGDNVPSKEEVENLIKKIKKKVEEENNGKEKFDWWKYRHGFLFLLILGLGLQGWYAGIVEKMAERAR